MSKTYPVNTLDYLRGNCSYEGCKYNNSGECQCTDGDFLLSIIEDIQGAIEDELEGLTTSNFDCFYAEANIGHCIYCDCELDRLEETYPYGDTSIREIYYGCRYCD